MQLLLTSKLRVNFSFYLLFVSHVHNASCPDIKAYLTLTLLQVSVFRFFSLKMYLEETI